ncbi:hypothetical protein CVT24_003574 [Panaeolus cyanescens]|uniref:Uncharacterized protein n=1 Tax=Panaeolus cyanescens TaxID=181874 RepID=A0A409Y7D1_9AGAR|nr:hypothetical protein CVT24_003574 [Panaeolus cyanescens]
MAFIIRDPRFSMSVVDSDIPKMHYPRVSYAKQIERRIVSVWKLVTGATRKQPRNSVMFPDFVAVTHRRRSIHPSQAFRTRN